MHSKILELAITEAKANKHENLEKAQDMLLEYLKSHPKDTEAWLLVTKIECSKSVEYADKIKYFAQQILNYETGNPYALLFYAYAEYYMRGCSDDTLYSRLIQAKSNDPEILSMIELAKAFYWKHRDIVKYEEALKSAIEYWPLHANHYCKLGELYLDQGKINDGIRLIKKGLDNVKEIAAGTEFETPYDPTSMTDFLAEFFAGTLMNAVQYALLINKISKHSDI